MSLHNLRARRLAEYADYVDRHIQLVKDAWGIVQAKCADMHPIYDDFSHTNINTAIIEHDDSKWSKEEFVPYAEYFSPMHFEVKSVLKSAFDLAWQHHLANNPHHWQTALAGKQEYPNQHAENIVAMCCDLIAMSAGRQSALDYYLSKIKEQARFPRWADELVMEILTRCAA